MTKKLDTAKENLQRIHAAQRKKQRNTERKKNWNKEQKKTNKQG
jgi:hypothetical protein